MDKALYFYSMIMCGVQLCLELHFFVQITKSKGKAVHYVFFTTLTLCCLYLLQPYNAALLNIGISVAIMSLLGIFFLKVTPAAGLSAAFLISILTQLSFGIFNSLTGVFSPLLYAKSPKIIGFFFMFSGGIFSLLLLCFCLHIIDKKFPLEDAAQKNYISMVFTPFLMIFMASEYISNTVYSNVTTMDERGNLLGANHLQMLFLQIFCLLSVFSVLYAHKKICMNALSENRLALLEQESSFGKKYVEEAKQRYVSTNAFRHDIRNHLSVLNGLLTNDDIHEAIEYLHRLDIISADLSFPFTTNNSSLDILLCSKLEFAAQHRIQISCKVKIPSTFPVEDTDLCTVFFNAVDNALTACMPVSEQLRYLDISDSVQGNFYMLAFENSTNTDASQISFQSHEGLGLFNIRTVAEKYGGTVMIENTDNVFRLHVLFIISHH